MTDASGVTSPFAGLTMERLQSFLAVAEAGGIARAAPGNPSRQSQLSRQLREVSAALGFEVMVREGRGMALTAEGVRLRAMLRELGAGLEALRRARAATPLDVTLAAGDSVLRWAVLPRLHEALAGVEGVSLALHAVTRGFEAVRDGAFDLALSRARRPPDGMRVARVGTLRYGLFAPRALRRRALDAASLATLPWVHVTGAPDKMAALAEALRATPRVALRCETFPQAALAVASGAYASVLPRLAAPELAAQGVAPVEAVSLAALDLPLALVARTRRLDGAAPLAALFAALAQHLRRALSG